MVRRVRLTVRLDPIADMRRAIGGVDPDPADAAVLADFAGVDGIGVRYHPDHGSIQERDLDVLCALVKCHLTVEVTRNAKTIDAVLKRTPDRVLLICDSSFEMTGDRQFGVDVAAHPTHHAPLMTRCREAGVSPWILLDPCEEQVSAARDVGAEGVVLDASRYAMLPEADGPREPENRYADELVRLETAAHAAAELGLTVAASGGLGRRNLPNVVTIPGVDEIILGHAVAARALFIGFEHALQEILDELPRVGEEP